MFELIIMAALNQSPHMAAVPNLGSAKSANAIEGSELFRERDTTPLDYVEMAAIKRRASDWDSSIEAASVHNEQGDTKGGRLRHESVITAELGKQQLAGGNAPNVAHDAMLAKRWHWFQVHGVSQLHAVLNESREPWWLAY
ncbi:MAG: hypothetical protein ACI915_002786 [Gammaproteobacteria bacterium]|jgi:hypothetical protein